MSRQTRLHVLKASREPVGGFPQGVFRRHVRVPRVVYQGEQQVAKLVLPPFRGPVVRHGLPKLPQLLLDFFPGLVSVRKLEPHARCLFLHPLGPQQSRQLGRHPIEHRGLLRLAVLLPLLDLFPGGRHRIRVARCRVPEDMRVAPDKLIRFCLNHVRERKSPALLRNNGVKEHVQKHVAQLLRQFVPVSMVDGRHHLVGLLNKQVLCRLVGLLPVPRAVAPQLLNDGRQVRVRLQPLGGLGELGFVDLVGRGRVWVGHGCKRCRRVAETAIGSGNPTGGSAACLCVGSVASSPAGTSLAKLRRSRCANA